MSNENNTSNQLEPLDGERGLPSVNNRGLSTSKRGAIVLGLLLVVGLAAGVAYWKIQQRSERDVEAQKEKTMKITSAVPSRTFTNPPADLDAAPTTSVTPAPVVPIAAPPLPGSGGQAMDQRQLLLTLDKSGSNLMVVVKDQNSGGDINKQQKPQSNQKESGPLSALLTGTKTNPNSAGHLGNRNFILAKGGFIDCALQTKLDSTVPGMTSCVVTRNIYSDNGKVLLIERGSTVSGEYQSNMRQGMARIFVLWTRIKTPNGVVVNIDSPGTDPLGGAGVPGWVDNHFWERFGGALMLSLIDDVARFATQNNDSNSGQINFTSTGEATQNMAVEALKNTINISPTLYKNQGEQVGIYIARDLNFSSVYDVTATTE